MRFFLVAIAVLLASDQVALAQEKPALSSLFGTFVGYASLEDPKGSVVEEREIDIMIEPYENSGVLIRWINVSLKDGRRDWSGVTRRVSEIGLVPSDRGDFFVRGAKYNPFDAKQAFRPYQGSPVQWAFLDSSGLHVYSFVIEPDGRFELQRYTRDVDGDTLSLEFERIDDGTEARLIDGHAVRANVN